MNPALLPCATRTKTNEERSPDYQLLVGGTASGAAKLEGGKFVAYPDGQAGASEEVTCLCLADDGTLYAGAGGKLKRFSNDKWENMYADGKAPANIAYVMCQLKTPNVTGSLLKVSLRMLG